MNSIIRVAILVVVFFTLSSGGFKKAKNIELPPPGMSIIYGKLTGMGRAAYKVGWLRDLETKKVFKYYAKCTTLNSTEEEVYAFIVPPSKYELYAYVSLFGGNSQSLHCWSKNKANTKGFSKKKAEPLKRSVLKIEESKTYYLGEWDCEKGAPRIVMDKVATDSDISGKSPSLKTENAITLMPE